MKKILIVDNDRVTLKFMAKLLEKEGHQVLTEENGLNALDRLKTYTPDVIFVDLVMPHIDGETLCGIIKDTPKLKDTYLVLLSAIAAEEWVDITKLGADACIAKGPFNEMSQHVLFVLEQPDSASSQSLSGKVFGLKDVYPRSITKELLKVKRHFQVVLEKMTEGILEINKEGRIVYVNKKALLLIDMPEKDLLGSHFVDLFSGDDYLRVVDLMKMMGRKTIKISDDAPLRLNKFQVTLNILPLDDDESKSITILHDVSERKQAEVLLRESEEKYRNILESIEDGCFEVDIDGNFTFFNDSMCKILGYPRNELMGMNYREYMDQKNAKKIYQTFNKVFRIGIPTKALDWQFIRKDGSECFVETVVSLIKDSKEQPTGFRGIARDVTERKLAEKEKKMLEAQLYQAERIESLGTLAGGIAHDFNNLLMGIQGRTSLMLMDSDVPRPLFEHLWGIEESVKSASDLTKQLLGFARAGKYEVKTTDLNALIKNQSQMFGRTRKEINIQEKFEDKLWSAEVDQGQIGQVLLNLFVNAWQAMPGGGDLIIQTENFIIKENYNKPYHMRPGKYIKISVTDTGAGMDMAIQQRIFDPFFTTKEMGRGTGLGLASAYGIVKNHSGYIDVYSEKGRGTTLEIYLPASDKKVVKKENLPEEVLGGTETILFVDDEYVVIDVGQQMLKTLGYTVFQARSGKEAIEVYRKNQNEVDMVILDMIMPEMSGGETYDRLKEINPDIKVLLSSGYSVEGQATDILGRGCNGFIQKPFNTSVLSKKIREILDED